MEATNTSETDDGDAFVETLNFIDNNGELSTYTNWKLNDQNVLESYYEGTEELGFATTITPTQISEEEYYGIDLYTFDLAFISIFQDYPAIIFPSAIIELQAFEDYYFEEGELTLDNGT